MKWIGQALKARYIIDSELGAGGMGAVFLGHDKEVENRRVVVKIPHANLLNDEFRARFEREISQLVQLEHPRIIHVYDKGEQDGVPFLVVQYVAGGDLRKRMPLGSRLEPNEILKWLSPIAEALDFIHERRRVHRDVKPGNVLFDAAGNPYLADFGIATVMTRVEEATSSGQLTGTGLFVGSPTYAPPEASHRDLRPQYDQYSLGLMVYEALTGSFPFEGESGPQIMTAKSVREPRSIEGAAPDVPLAAGRAVMRALSRDPEERFGTCRDFVEAFRAGLREPTPVLHRAEMPTAVGPTEPTGRQPSWSQRTALGGAALLLVGLALALKFWPDRETAQPAPKPSQTSRPQVLPPEREPEPLLAAGSEVAKAGATEREEVRPSGLRIIHQVVGEGESPTATSTVRVHYHGTRQDGTVFDSSVERSQPATFPLSRVIPCWTEAIALMRVGGKASLVCPPAIAYGERGAPPRIPANATLNFEVELIEIMP